MTPQWKRIWRPFLIPLVLLMCLWLIWYRLRVVRELVPSPEMRARLEAICKKANVPYPIPSPKLVVHKSARTLELYSGDRLLKTYRIALGRDPLGPKKLANDGKTPEGQYLICVKIPRAQQHRYLGINYPNATDAVTGFNEGRIPLVQREEISQANRLLPQAKRSLPRIPSNTPLGGNVGLHGGGSKSDWTDGSIAVNDADIEEIFYAVRLKDPIQITP